MFYQNFNKNENDNPYSRHGLVQLIALGKSILHKWVKMFTNLTSSIRATIPAAKGADAEVPVCVSVHLLCKSTEIYKHQLIST